MGVDWGGIIGGAIGVLGAYYSALYTINKQTKETKKLKRIESALSVEKAFKCAGIFITGSEFIDLSLKKISDGLYDCCIVQLDNTLPSIIYTDSKDILDVVKISKQELKTMFQKYLSRTNENSNTESENIQVEIDSIMSKNLDAIRGIIDTIISCETSISRG